MGEPTCSKCRGAMDEGFVLDRYHHSSLTQETWVEGPPQRSFWWGLTLKDRETLPVATFRCRSCGYLEGYARKVDQ
jgi:hypothetical protein